MNSRQLKRVDEVILASGLPEDAKIFILDAFDSFFIYSPRLNTLKVLTKRASFYESFLSKFKIAIKAAPSAVKRFRVRGETAVVLRANTTKNNNPYIQDVVNILYEFFKNPKLTRFVGSGPLKKDIVSSFKRYLGDDSMEPQLTTDKLPGNKYYVMLYDGKVFIYNREKEKAYRPNKKFAQAVWDKVMPIILRKMRHVEVGESLDSKTVLVIDSLKKVGAIIGTLATILTAVLQIKTLSSDLKQNFNREIDDHERNEQAYYRQKARWSSQYSAFRKDKKSGFAGRMERDDFEEFLNDL